jgi:SNF2 family DNA or RNA helicase
VNAITPITYVTNDGRHVIVPFRDDLARAVPHARAFDYHGEPMLLVPNGSDEARVARNLGIPVPSPILTRYDWRGTKPWDIQRVTAALLTESPRCYVLSSMGTGKTRSVLFAADWLMRTHGVKRMLIAATLSTLTPVWERETFQVMMKRRVKVLYGDRAKRLKLLSEPADIYVINHHGLNVIQQALIDKAFDIVVLDELAVFRNKSTELWKGANAVLSAPSVKYVWGLTGSPTPNAPTDAWAQVKLLTPNQTTRTMTSFQDQTMRRVSQFKWVPRHDANEIVRTAMSPSVRFTLDDVMELPDTLYVDRSVVLDTDAGNAYKMLYTKARLLTTQGAVSAVNEGILQSKLLQVAAGYIYCDDKTVYQLPSSGRLRALEDTIAETDRKILVMVPFLHALSGVAAHLRAKHYDVAVVHGGTSRTLRDKIFTQFQTTNSPRIIVAHPQTLAHGLTLTEANVIVWYSPTTSLDIYEQANARIVRPGQTAKTVIVHLTGTPVESATYTRLRAKAKMQGCLLGLFAQQELKF